MIESVAHANTTPHRDWGWLLVPGDKSHDPPSRPIPFPSLSHFLVSLAPRITLNVTSLLRATYHAVYFKADRLHTLTQLLLPFACIVCGETGASPCLCSASVHPLHPCRKKFGFLSLSQEEHCARSRRSGARVSVTLLAAEGRKS